MVTRQAPIRVVVADDQDALRASLVTMLSLHKDIDVVGQASDGSEAVKIVGVAQPDVVLMDLRMPILDGVEATALILEALPRTRILVLTTFSDDATILDALRAGAAGYLTKDTPRDDIVAAIRAVHSGQRIFTAEVGEVLVGALLTHGDAFAEISPEVIRTRYPSLSTRESEVLAHVSEGLSNTEIAARLYVSMATVKSHINSIFTKTGIRDRSHAIAAVRSSIRHPTQKPN